VKKNLTKNQQARKRRSFTLDSLKLHTSSLGGKCLSKKYVNSTYQLLFECQKEHRWKASALQVIGKKNCSGTWCPKC